MQQWVETSHIVVAATKNLKSVGAGVKVTKRSACGELTKHMNDMSEKTGADAGTTELSQRS
jgi:hypothetical protein